MSNHSMFKAVLLAGLIGAGGAAAAQGWGGHHHHDGAGGPFMMLHALSLTDAQKQQVHGIMQSNHAATEATRTQLRAVENQISAKLTASGPVAMADVAPLLQQKEQLAAELDQARMATVLQVRAVLTPAQISRAATLETQLHALHQQEHALMAGGGTAPTAE